MKPAEVSTPSDREVLVKRSFDAPVNLVWQAYTEPALMRRWLTAMPGWSMPVCEMATHVGGKYRWRWRDNENGQEFGFTGEMLEVALHSKIVHTQIFDPGDLGGSMGGEPYYCHRHIQRGQRNDKRGDLNQVRLASRPRRGVLNRHDRRHGNELQAARRSTGGLGRVALLTHLRSLSTERPTLV